MGKEYCIVWFVPGPFPVGNIFTYLTAFALSSLHCAVVYFKFNAVRGCSELGNYLSKIDIVALDISSPQSDLRYVRLLRNSDVHSFHCLHTIHGAMHKHVRAIQRLGENYTAGVEQFSMLCDSR
jgi:hypothetical protein